MSRLLTLISGAILSIAPGLAAAPRPNIILAMADDMGWGDPGYNSSSVTFANGSPHPDQGWINTPTMNAMAASGLRFDRFYSASAVCSPTRASCLTGRNPFRVGVPTANSGRLGFDESPLSEVLSAAGYRCGHFGKWHLGSLTTLRSDSNRGGNAGVYSGPWHHSYDFCFCTESKVPTYHPYRKSGNSTPLPTGFDDSNWYGTYYWRMPATWNETSGEGEIVPISEVDVDHPDNPETYGDDSRLIADQSIGFIQDAVAAGEPFFVVLWFHTPHKPVVDPQRTSGSNSSDAARDSIEDLDAALGQVRDELATLGVRGNTMFWVTSDNGPENGVNSPSESSTVRSIRSGRFLERKRSLHEGGVRVPGILEWPDVITTGMATAFPAVTSDYYPTILDYLELSVPGQKPLDGISLRPVIEGTATTRSKPIGFKISGDRSWVNQQYKLIDDGSGWELHNLLAPAAGEEVEETPVATAADIGTKPQLLQDTYNQMLAEFTAWDSSVASDAPYVHASQPTVTLTTPASSVSGPFTVTAAFSESVSQLHAGEFVVTNGSASGLTGSAGTWSVTITPLVAGEVTVHLPEGAANDMDGNPNGASNLLTVGSTNGTVSSPPPIVSTLAPSTWQTVDSADQVPGSHSNNLTKFMAGTVNDGVSNPFTTLLYLRSSNGSEATERRVRAFVKFDLSGLHGLPVAGATLHFNGHSLNDQQTVNIEAIGLGGDWSGTGAPVPTFNQATFGSPSSGESIIAGLGPLDHTRDYSLDVTEAVQAWSGGLAPNYGIQLRLDNLGTNNGVGVRTSGPGSITLDVVELPLVIKDIARGPGLEDITLEWFSVPGVTYRIETSETLDGDWHHLADVASPPGPVTFHTHADALGGNGIRFYRVAFPPFQPPVSE